MDLITDLPPAAGFDSILVVVDQGLSKGVILLPCNKTITSQDTAKLLLENLYKRFGLPDKIISDRGPQFASKAFLELLELLGIKSALVWDGGYHVPGGFTGRVLTGKGTGTDFGTRWKPVPEHTRDPHVTACIPAGTHGG